MLIETQNLTKIYTTGETEVRALNDVSLAISEANLFPSSAQAAAANPRSCICSAGLTFQRMGKYTSTGQTFMLSHPIR